jgi:hypothetical protein
MNGRDEKFMKKFYSENENRDHLEYRVGNGKIVLILILIKQCMGMWIGFIRLSIGISGGLF